MPDQAADGVARVLVVHGGRAAPAWAAQAGLAPPVLAPAADGVALADIDCALVDTELADPLAVARRLHQADADVQVVLVGTEERRRRVERALLFTPGLGELWLASPTEIDGALAERAAGVTRARRRYRRTRERIARDGVQQSPQRAERALISDAYLADLLQVLPDAVFSVDAAGRVLSANPAAERLLGASASALVGSPLADALGAGGAAVQGVLAALAAEDAPRTASVELPFRRAEADAGVGFGELLATRVAGAATPLVAVVLHDLTDRQAAQQQLQDQAAEMEAVNEELAAANDELVTQRAQLEAALAARSRFYAAMSHELRTPINAVMGYTALTLEGIYGPLTSQQREGLERAQRAAQHLLELVNDVLDLAKIEAGRMELVAEDVDPVALARDILLSVLPSATAAGTEVRLACEAPGGTVALHTDPRRVRQVLLNLLSNALRFGDGRPVVLRCGPAGPDAYAFAVEDQGVGIPVEAQERIFEEFVQLEADRPGGTGLGLTISRRLARLLGGALHVRSAPGEGSTFTLVLPLGHRSSTDLANSRLVAPPAGS